MHRQALLLVASYLALGCVTPGGSGAAGGGSGQHECDNRDDCGSCSSCALNGPCSEAYTACQQSSACNGVDQCMGLCGFNDTCRQQCYSSNPEGASQYEAVLQCAYCNECPGDCVSHWVCG
jgi:hypothetical protein